MALALSHWSCFFPTAAQVMWFPISMATPKSWTIPSATWFPKGRSIGSWPAPRATPPTAWNWQRVRRWRRIWWCLPPASKRITAISQLIYSPSWASRVMVCICGGTPYTHRCQVLPLLGANWPPSPISVAMGSSQLGWGRCGLGTFPCPTVRRSPKRSNRWGTGRGVGCPTRPPGPVWCCCIRPISMISCWRTWKLTTWGKCPMSRRKLSCRTSPRTTAASWEREVRAAENGLFHDIQLQSGHRSISLDSIEMP